MEFRTGVSSRSIGEEFFHIRVEGGRLAIDVNGLFIGTGGEGGSVGSSGESAPRGAARCEQEGGHAGSDFPSRPCMAHSASGLLLLHSAFAEKKPVEGDALLRRKRNQEVRMRSRTVLVAVDVLLEDPEFSSELSL